MLETIGPLSGHMGLHILLMNALAPLVALGLRARLRVGPPGVLWLAVVLQLALLWGWHAPPVFGAAMATPVLGLSMQASLFGSALLFWGAILGAAGNDRWRAILALLVTSKLFCLLAVLLVFSPRALYPALAAGHGAYALSPTEDQQLAGLLMLVVCPAVYVGAGLVIAARWFAGLCRGDSGTVAAAEPSPT